MRRHHALPIAATVLSFLLAGCGLDGTDRYREDARAAASPAAVATPAAATDDLVEVDLPDSTPRPTMRLQVVLDSQGFGPGVIDGRDGLSTVNALKGFQEANGLDVTGELDEETKAALARWDDVAATRVVRVPASWGDDAYRAVPDAPEDQARMDRLGYASIDERLAERFHTTVAVLRTLNPGRPARWHACRRRSDHVYTWSS